MARWQKTFRDDPDFGPAVATLIDSWLPRLDQSEEGRKLIEDLRRLSTVPKTPAGDRLLQKALRSGRGPRIVPEDPGQGDMTVTTNAYIHPNDKKNIKVNTALLRAFAELQDNKVAVDFIKGTLLHELVHWCRLNNTDTSKRSPRRNKDFGRKLERLFYGLSEIGPAIQKSGELLKAYFRYFDDLTDAFRRSAAASPTPAATPSAAPQTPATGPDSRRRELAGIPLHYDRFNADGSDYGTIGKPINPLINIAFANTCDALFADMQARLFPQFGAIEAIVTGGIMRSGTGPSLHHQNRAFDLDGLAFKSGKFWRADSFPSEPHLYLAIESDIRRHFAIVLPYEYDARHRDHIHFDNGRKNKFRKTTRTHSMYVQIALNKVYLVAVEVDGVWGSETQAAATEVCERLGIGPFSELENWLAFCDTTADRALSMI